MRKSWEFKLLAKVVTFGCKIKELKLTFLEAELKKKSSYCLLFRKIKKKLMKNR